MVSGSAKAPDLMITAHLPAGYLLSRGLQRPERLVLPAVLLGSIFPDFDFIFFIFVDHGAIHHHRYWVHIPLFWLGVSAVILPLSWRSRAKWPVIGFLSAIFVHLFLDTIVGGIMWEAPFSRRLISFFTVPRIHDVWLWNFVLHWTFLLEIAIWIAAVSVHARTSPGFGLSTAWKRRPVTGRPEHSLDAD